MGEKKKGIFLYFINWLLLLLFYFSSILELVGVLLQKISKTIAIPATSIFIDILIIVIVSYFVNLNFIKAKKLTFFVTQAVFGISVILLFAFILRSVAVGILNA